MTLELGVVLLVLYGETSVLREPNLMCQKSFVIKNNISRDYRILSIEPIPPSRVEMDVTVSCVKGCCKQYSAVSSNAWTDCAVMLLDTYFFNSCWNSVYTQDI